MQSIVEELHAGMSVAEMLEAHPRLTAEDIRAAEAFAEEYMTQSAAE